MGLAANFLSKMEQNISIELRCGLFAGHSNTFSFNFAIFSWTSFDVWQGVRSCWNVYVDLFGNVPIDCVNSCCRTSQYNVLFIVPSKILAAVVPSADMSTLPPSQVFICWTHSSSSRPSSVLQIFTWFFRFKTSKVDSLLKIIFRQPWKV